MLKLITDGQRRLPASQSRINPVAVPEYIMLNERFITIGRSYKADVKLMLPFISRRHLTVGLFLI